MLLRKRLPLPFTKIETDSYVAVQLLEQKKTLDFASLKYMAEQVEGSFTFTVLDQRNHLYILLLQLKIGKHRPAKKMGYKWGLRLQFPHE